MKFTVSVLVLFFVMVNARAAEIRLAIVPADARGAVAGELLTAEFSRAESGVPVLERAEVERIRRELNFKLFIGPVAKSVIRKTNRSRLFQSSSSTR